jgi:GTPase SAR1 family protein
VLHAVAPRRAECEFPECQKKNKKNKKKYLRPGGLVRGTADGNESPRHGMPLSSEHDAKVVILGASGVGKTCIGLRFVKNQFIP